VETLIPTLKSVSEIVEDFRAENIAIPEIQRDVVWTTDQVKELIDSISRGYPCGSLIFWEPREKDKQLVRSMIRPERLRGNGNDFPRYFLLDGQQRVTALASVLLKRDKVRQLLAEVEDDLPYVFVNLKRFPREFEATTDPAGYRAPWILFNKLFDGAYRTEADLANLPPGTGELIQEFVQRIRDYKFPVQIIRDRDYATVGEIFTRVNSAGTQLTGAEIHLARIVPYWRGITREFREYRRDLMQKSYDLDLTFLMRAITVVECNVPQIKKLADKIAKDRPSRVRLNKTWRRARAAIDKTIRILQRDLQLDKSKFVTSKNALVPLVYSLSTLKGGRRLEREVRRFFVLSQLAGHYSAAAETALRKDFRALTDSSRKPLEALSDLVGVVDKEARQEYRGLKIKPGDVYGLPSRNVLVLLMYILMRQRHATDWGGSRRPRLEEIEPRAIQLHHIFPFDYMSKNRNVLKWYLDNGYSATEYRYDVNDIANLTFLSQGKNSEIKETPPAQYLPNETTKEMRRAHFIPENPELWKSENFPKFLEARRELLANAVTKLLKQL
jgi:hypothetical protein